MYAAQHAGGRHIYKHRDTEQNTLFHFFNSISILWTFKKHRKNRECCPLSDCKSLILNVMIQVSQFIRNGQLCH